MKTLGLILLVFLQFQVSGQNFVFVFLNKKENKSALPSDEVDKIQEGHMANITRLAKEGKLWAAGPFEGGGGIFIFKSNSIVQVEEWLSTDPGIKANRWDIEVFPYYPHIGSVCAVGEKYEMTNYAFVRFLPNITKYSIGSLPDDWRSHERFIQHITAELDVIAEGSFGDQEGGILVLNGVPLKAKLENDPAVQKGSLDMDIKKLYIARGSFCEPHP